jgi:hypothetical protein
MANGVIFNGVVFEVLSRINFAQSGPSHDKEFGNGLVGDRCRDAKYFAFPYIAMRQEHDNQLRPVRSMPDLSVGLISPHQGHSLPSTAFLA